MTKFRAEDLWGHSAPNLSTRLIQIGDNNFADHRDYAKYVEEKTKHAIDINKHIRAQPGEIGLEIGSGTGVHTRYFAARSGHVHTVDVSSGFSDLFLETTQGVANITYDVRTFFPMFSHVLAGSASYCYSSAVFCHLHIYDIYLYFEELSQKLGKGGRFYVNFQNAEYGATDFFMAYLEAYRGRGEFTPIPPTQMQFHSNVFFEHIAERMGFDVRTKTVVGKIISPPQLADKPFVRIACVSVVFIDALLPVAVFLRFMANSSIQRFSC